MVEQFSKKTEQVVETTHETYELNDTKEGTQSPKLKVESIDVNILRPEAILHGGSSAGLNDFETNRSYELETLDVTRDNAFEYSAEYPHHKLQIMMKA
ncbi:unnamed protein product [[Candida] boidinii]|nr:unnamed protein product [[Candida] boidinii]